jgi:hypothetical protein
LNRPAIALVFGRELGVSDLDSDAGNRGKGGGGARGRAAFVRTFQRTNHGGYAVFEPDLAGEFLLLVTSFEQVLTGAQVLLQLCSFLAVLGIVF